MLGDSTMINNTAKSIIYGVLASLLLLAVYFSILSLVSGWGFAQNQFASFWYFIVSLAVGFGIQVGLFTYLRDRIHSGRGGGKVLGVTGTTSTAAMVSCCAHYLVNLLPVLGVTALVTLVAEYQTELVWIGLLFNLGGIVYIASKIVSFKKFSALVVPLSTEVEADGTLYPK